MKPVSLTQYLTEERRAGYGDTDLILSMNIQGEAQKKLDVISNEILLDANAWGGHLAACASEEMEHPQQIPDAYPRGGYLLLFDPLDGSSNIDVNISVGTIFSVLKRPGGHRGKVDTSEFLQPGTNQVAAGYVVYGSCTLLVLTLGHGTHVFTLDREAGSFILTRRDVQIPEDTSEFAINMCNQRFWEAPMQRYIHRILTRGGIFIYPWDKKDPTKVGKLRLMYEANPMSFIVEQAGGAASTGRGRIMEVQPEGLHQRVPVILGSKNEVKAAVQYHTDA